MITLVKYGNNFNQLVLFLSGLSTDNKPIGTYIERDDIGTVVATKVIPNGSKFNEIDTGNTYQYDKENQTWNKTSGGGGGGSATLIEKSIDSNGVYNASSDNADGYSKVNVDVVPEYTEFEARSYTAYQPLYPSNPVQDFDNQIKEVAILIPQTDTITVKSGYVDALNTPKPVVIVGTIKRLNVTTVNLVWLIVTLYISSDFEGIYLDGNLVTTPTAGSITTDAWNSLLFQNGEFKNAKSNGYIGIVEESILDE